MTAKRLSKRNELAADRVRIMVVRTIDELMQVTALRALTYMVEQSCPYVEEFDGNDLCATHILAIADKEPVATMRIRWFADFAKFERICVHPKSRGGRTAERLVTFGYELAARKGYSRVLAHANANLVGHWKRVAGMNERLGRERFRFSEQDYVEVQRDLAPHKKALSINSRPLQLVRPEGDWDRPGVLEANRSKARSR